MSAHFLFRDRQRLLAIAIVSTLLFILASGVEAQNLQVHFIDVGQGDCIYVLTPDGYSLLIDAGDVKAGPKVVQYLTALGVKKIDVLVSTHPHSDHIGGMQAVLAAFKVGQVYDSGRLHTSKTFEEYLKTIDALQIPFALARTGDQIPLGSQVALNVLWPDGPRTILDYRNLNESSIVLLLEYGQVRFLFTGDAGIESEERICTTNLLSKVAVLKVGHHGSRSSTGAQFLKAVAPQTAVIMLGTGNPYGHPHPEVIRRLEQGRVQVLRTDQEGTIIITSDGQDYFIVQPASYATSQPLDPSGSTSSLVNVNLASSTELQTLPGIGEVLAQRIIEYRIKVGLFSSPEDLLNVKGIGVTTLEKIQTLITF